MAAPTTTEAVRRTIQNNQESLMVLATYPPRDQSEEVAKWKWQKRAHVTDARMGPKEVRQTSRNLSIQKRLNNWLPFTADAAASLPAFILRGIYFHFRFQIHGQTHYFHA
jgi:hypothetical protein